MALGGYGTGHEESHVQPVCSADKHTRKHTLTAQYTELLGEKPLFENPTSLKHPKYTI